MSKNFEDIVRAMSIKEIILAMVRGLRQPKVKVSMATYGEIINGVCFGCAATNMICEIQGTAFKLTELANRWSRANALHVEYMFLQSFEHAINVLRIIDFDLYNMYAFNAGIAEIPEAGYNGLEQLPELTTHYTPHELQAWENFANTL